MSEGKTFFDRPGRREAMESVTTPLFPLSSSIFTAEIRILGAPVVRVLPDFHDDDVLRDIAPSASEGH